MEFFALFFILNPEQFECNFLYLDIKTRNRRNRLTCVFGSGTAYKWPDKSTTSYDKLDFKSYMKNLEGKYLLIERHILQIQSIFCNI